MAWKDIDTVAINATTLGGLSGGDVPGRKNEALVPGEIIRISLDSQDVLIIALVATLGGQSCTVTVGGYGQGTKDRMNIQRSFGRVNAEVYFNGSSELGCIYIKTNFTREENIGITVSALSLRRRIFDVKHVSEIPKDATLALALNSTDLTLNSNNMQLTDYQHTNGGGISEPSS